MIDDKPAEYEPSDEPVSHQPSSVPLTSYNSSEPDTGARPAAESRPEAYTGSPGGAASAVPGGRGKPETTVRIANATHKQSVAPEEAAYTWLKRARRAIDELPHDRRWPSSSAASLAARLWLVRDALQTISKRAPHDRGTVPPQPAAQQLLSLFSALIQAIEERSVPSRGGNEKWGQWRKGAQDGTLARLREFAEIREARRPEEAELFTAGQRSAFAVDRGLAEMARELLRLIEK